MDDSDESNVPIKDNHIQVTPTSLVVYNNVTLLRPNGGGFIVPAGQKATFNITLIATTLTSITVFENGNAVIDVDVELYSEINGEKNNTV